MHEGLRQLADDYWDGSMARAPFVANVYGDNRFDDRVPDFSPSGLADRRAFATEIAARAVALGEDLDPSDRVTRDLLIDACTMSIEEIDCEQIQLQSDGFTAFPVTMLRVASRRTVPDPESATRQLEQLRKIPAVLDDVADHWQQGAARGWLPAATVVGRTKTMIDAYLAGPISDDPFVRLPVPDSWTGADEWRRSAAEIVTESVRPGYQRISQILGELQAAGRDDDHPGLCHVPGGEDLYASLVRRATTTDMTPEEIHAYGMTELTERLPVEWATVGERAVGVHDRAEIFELLRSDPAMKYRSPQEILDHATATITRATAESAKWFHRMPSFGVVVEEVPASLAPGSPPAYYGAPPSGGGTPGVYFANTFEPTRRNRFEAEVFAFHEAVPGHHLERASAVELDVPMFQRRGGYMAYSEGWGLYAERLADEMGLYSSDLMRLGMLSADAWRSARLVLDTGLHALGWSRARAIEFMTEHVPIAVDEAAVEVDRYIGMPGQALSYKIGQREMFRLRAEAASRLGARFDIRDFHHAVLGDGGVTLGILADLIDRWVRDADGLRAGA